MPIPTTRPTRPKVLACVLVAVVLQAGLAVLTNLNKLRAWPQSSFEDTDIYYRYATLALEGKIPYRDYSVEYPPLAVPLFLAPRAVARGLGGFKLAFAVEMLLFNAGTVFLVASWVERREGPGVVPARLAWYTFYFVILSRLIVSRYDAAPMFLGFGATVWWFSGRGRLGGLAAALGALVKVYPALVALLAGLWEWTRPRDGGGRGPSRFSWQRRLLRRAVWLALGGVGGVSRSLEYQLGRGFEYGSLYSGAQMLAAKLTGAEIVISRDHVSFSTITPWSARLLPLAFPVQSAAVLLVCGTFYRRGMTEEVRYSGSVVLAFIVFGRVFSPQYLIWLIPFLAALEGPIAARGRWLFAAGCAATLLAQGCIGKFSRTHIYVILAYNTKNFLLLWLLTLLVFGRAADPESV